MKRARWAALLKRSCPFSEFATVSSSSMSLGALQKVSEDGGKSLPLAKSPYLLGQPLSAAAGKPLLDKTLFFTYETLRIASIFLWPVTPTLSEKVLRILGCWPEHGQLCLRPFPVRDGRSLQLGSGGLSQLIAKVDLATVQKFIPPPLPRPSEARASEDS